MSALNRKLKSILSKPKPRSMFVAELEALIRERERAAAAKALTDAASDWESGTVEHDEIKRASDAPLGWGDASVVDAVMSSGPVMDWLRARAGAYRDEENDEQEGKRTGRGSEGGPVNVR